MYNTCKIKHKSCYLKHFPMSTDFFQKIFQQVMFVLTVSRKEEFYIARLSILEDIKPY